jgi:hypothetical protein
MPAGLPLDSPSTSVFLAGATGATYAHRRFTTLTEVHAARIS